MSELQFPKDPLVGQEYDFPPYKYYWDGVKWKTKGIGYNPVNDLREDVVLRDQLAAVGSQVLIGGVKADTIASNINNGFFKNKIVDGRFDFWYEGTSQTSNGYGSDTMWSNNHTGSSKTHTRQTLVPGVDLPSIDVPSAKYFSRTVVNSVAGSLNNAFKTASIEGVITFAGKKATLSFYAKADTAKNIVIEFVQNFGSSGSPSAPIEGIGAQLVALSTAWKRYEITVDIPSISGKTISTDATDRLILFFWFDAGSSWAYRTGTLGQQSGTFDLACVQLEEGEQATKFEELSKEISKTRVNRYFYPITNRSTPYSLMGYPISSWQANFNISIPIPMRTIAPVMSSNIGIRQGTSTFTQISVFADMLQDAYATITVSISGSMTPYAPCLLTSTGLSFLDARL